MGGYRVLDALRAIGYWITDIGYWVENKGILQKYLRNSKKSSNFAANIAKMCIERHF